LAHVPADVYLRYLAHHCLTVADDVRAVACWIGQGGKVSLQRIAVILILERQTLEDDARVAALVEVALLIVGNLAEITAMTSKYS
jgi:hypothetical protein